MKRPYLYKEDIQCNAVLEAVKVIMILSDLLKFDLGVNQSVL